MQLVPKYADESAAGSAEEGGVAVLSQTLQNLGIRIEPARMTNFGEDLAAVGRIEPDERRFYAVQTRIPGFVERLMVRAVGDPVSKGQKIAEVYAPELLAAQQEYLALLKLDNVPDSDALKQSARNRLKLLGMTEGEVSAITKSGSANPRFGIYAPASGVLTELGVREGAQLMPGTSLMQITDLSTVWLMAEVPERDAARLKIGSPAQVELQSLSGETFKGRVGYFYPMLDEATRTLKVRIELPNKGGRLRPGMYANVLFTGQNHEALAVPTESVIATGTRKVVIVREEHGFRPAEITTGREGGGNTEILSGLKAGENVVVSGQFLIDSEASLSGVLARLSQQSAQRDKP
jgi:Cu(I)/Ag(I) efflux system membrane fusion protein